MVNLSADGLLAKWFVWCCDYLPLTTGHKEEGGKLIGKNGAFYRDNGTTLCHLFWAMLWVPILMGAICGGVLFILAALHVELHQDVIARNYFFFYQHPIIGVFFYFIPEMAMLVFAAVVGLLILAIIGGDKSGFFKLLWQYLKGIKSRICPLVRFEQ